MSRILRRPMFRGGRVSSYGTGIASGLADGGRVGFRNGGGSYTSNQGMVLGSDLMNFVKQNPKYGSLEFANTLNPKQFYNKPLDGTYQVGRGGPKIENSPEFLRLFQNYIDPETSLINPDEIDIETGLKIDETGSVSGKGGEGSEGEISITESETTNKGDGDDGDDGGAGAGEELPSIGDDEAALQKQADEYFKLLGGDKAKAGEISNMLLRFAGSKGDTVMEKFTDFAAAESKIPSETKRIKQAAAMAAIKGDQAKETAMYAMQKGIALKMAGLTDTKKDRATTTRLSDYAKEFMKDVTNPFKQKNAGAFAAAQVLSENLLDKQGEFVSVMVYDEAGEAKPVSGAIYIDPIQGMAAGTPFYYNGKFYKTLAQAKKIKSGG